MEANWSEDIAGERGLWSRDLPGSAVLDRVLIIAPLKVCLTTWSTEAAKWDHLKDLTISVAVGSPKERLAVE